MIKSLVTGGAGFIGTHVVKHLLQMGHEIVILDDLSGGFIENVDSRATFVQGSITDVALVADLFKHHQFTYVYHLAAYAAEGLSHFIRRFNYQNNVMGSIHLINAAIQHEIKCFVFTSSIAVYGTNTLPMVEQATPKPEDPYGIAKYAIELDLEAAHNLFGLNYVIFRPHNVYGEFQNIGDRYRNVIGIFMNQILQNKALTIYGDGEQSRAFSYIDDVAPYIARCVDVVAAQNEIFNIGGDQSFSVNQLAQTILKVMQKEIPIEYLAHRKEVVHAYADHSKIKAAFNIQESTLTPLEEGLAKMALWVQKHGTRKTKAFEAIEIFKNLPQNWLS